MILSYTHEINRLIDDLRSTAPSTISLMDRINLLYLKKVLDKLIAEAYSHD